MATNQQPNDKGQNAFLLSLLCLAVYRMGGTMTLGDLDELKQSLFIPSIEPVSDGVVKLTISKYTRQEPAPVKNTRKRHGNPK